MVQWSNHAEQALSFFFLSKNYNTSKQCLLLGASFGERRRELIKNPFKNKSSTSNKKGRGEKRGREKGSSLRYDQGYKLPIVVKKRGSFQQEKNQFF